MRDHVVRFTAAGVAVLLSTLFPAFSALAAEPFGGPPYETSVPILDLQVGVRNLAMGATGVSSVNSASGYYNPASVAWADATKLSFGYLDGPVDIEMTDTRATYRFLRGDDSSANVWRLGAEVGFTTLGIDPFIVRTVFLPEGTGETFDPNDYYVTSTLGLAWEHGNEAIAAGVSGKYLSLDRSGGNADSWLLDFGLVASGEYVFSFSTLRPRLGFSMNNLDSGLDYDSREYGIAGQTRYGGGVDFESASTTTWGREVTGASVSIDFDYVDRDRYTSYWALGWEVAVMEFFQARAGYQWFETNNNANMFIGAGLGWAFGSWSVQADYAHSTPNNDFEPVDLQRNAVSLTAGVNF